MDKQIEAILAKLAAAKTTGGIRLDANKVLTIDLSKWEGVLSLPPQARAIAIILIKDGRTELNQVELYELLMKHTEISKKQTPWEVWSFYKKQFAETGFIA